MTLWSALLKESDGGGSAARARGFHAPMTVLTYQRKVATIRLTCVRLFLLVGTMVNTPEFHAAWERAVTRRAQGPGTAAGAARARLHAKASRAFLAQLAEECSFASFSASSPGFIHELI